MRVICIDECYRPWGAIFRRILCQARQGIATDEKNPDCVGPLRPHERGKGMRTLANGALRSTQDIVFGLLVSIRRQPGYAQPPERKPGME